MPSMEEYKRILYVPYSVIIASFIIILITSGIQNENGLSALIGGYMGLFLGILIVIVVTWINMPSGNLLYLAPFILVLLIVFLLLYYLFTYYDRISKGEVSEYYSSYSTLSTIFLAVQVFTLFSALFNVDELTKKLLPYRTFALLILFGVIDFLIVITLGVILHFYSTQG